MLLKKVLLRVKFHQRLCNEYELKAAASITMSITINNQKAEARLNKCIQKIPVSLRPDKNKFVGDAINHYIDSLIKDKIIPKF